MATKRRTTTSRSSEAVTSDGSERASAPENGDTPTKQPMSSTTRTDDADNHGEAPSGTKPASAMSLQEKLTVIDSEIRTLHQFCINQGFRLVYELVYHSAYCKLFSGIVY